MKRYAMDYYVENTLTGPACNVTMVIAENGEWVRYEDADRLRAENERLRAGLKEVIEECSGFAGCESIMRLTAERALLPNARHQTITPGNINEWHDRGMAH